MPDTDPIPIESPARRARRAPDALAVLALVALWGLYFWRILTPQAQDAVSLTAGDFSGQFVAFFGYQVERLSAGEVPLWNPDNYAGHPFLADTQSAVFYPPRLLTVAAVEISGDTSPGALYTALQMEMALHVLLGTLLMYAFVRRLAARDLGAPPIAAVTGGLVAALTFGYGGFLSGYPQLQLAILEAGIWLPLALLAILEATRGSRPGWPCLLLAGVAAGLSLMAGHPQTTWFMLILALAFLAVRLWRGADDWRGFARDFTGAAAVFGIVAGGLAAVQLLPGLEYLRHATRLDMSFDAKSNGFPYSDLAQILFPNFITLFSPLYFGIAGLVLAIWAAARRAPFSAFFGIAALLALALSFGGGTAVYDAVYLLLPGASWFRGQERAAFVVAGCASVLAGIGAADLLTHTHAPATVRALRRALIALAGGSALAALGLFGAWIADRGKFAPALQSAMFTALLAALALALLPWLLRGPASGGRAALLVALIVFDLFSVTMGRNFESMPASDRLPQPEIVAWLDDHLPPGERIDARRGLRDNFGTLYDVPDIRGISPLRLDAIDHLLSLPDDRAWDLLAVRYVLTDWNELMVPSAIAATDADPYGAYNVHKLDAPRGFAHLTYGATVVASDADAYGLLREPSYDTKQYAILDRDPGVAFPADVPDDPGSAEVTTFEPERIVIAAENPAPAVLTLALPDYPGWQATVDGADADILRAYGGLSAVALPDAGAHTVELVYRPWSFRTGAIISIAAWLIVAALVVRRAWTRRHERAREV